MPVFLDSAVSAFGGKGLKIFVPVSPWRIGGSIPPHTTE